MKSKLLLMIIVCLQIVLSGCTNRNSLANRAQGTNMKLDMIGGTERAYKNSQSYKSESHKIEDGHEEFEDKNEKAKQKANAIANLIKKISGVKNVAVVVNGQTAIVGITRAVENSDDTDVVNLKKKIDKEVKKFDKTIKHVAVTASPELYARILNLSGGETGL